MEGKKKRTVLWLGHISHEAATEGGQPHARIFTKLTTTKSVKKKY